jgi:hypothetical protein
MLLLCVLLISPASKLCSDCTTELHPQPLVFVVNGYISGSGKKNSFPSHHKEYLAGCWWLTPIIQAAQEAEIRRIEV